ncbi:MAG: hypothetical protein IPM01_27575 [Burkholderiaceae bacterium]|nr:hypothetical protein [Burkholderiaceae bacterium]
MTVGPAKRGQRCTSAARQIPARRRCETERKLASTRRRLDELREELGKPFEYEERLTALLGRQRALAAELDLDKDEAGTQGLEATEESLAA